MNTLARSLQEAAAALDTLAAGQVPERATLLSGALAGLETLATGGMLDLDAAGRQRAAKLAERVRRELRQAVP
jgi:hypothetical protein